MTAIRYRLWVLSAVCCVLAAPAAVADAATRPTESSLDGDRPAAPVVFAAYPDIDSARAAIDRAAAVGEPLQSAASDPTQGMGWLVVLCVGVMVLAGFNSRKPRPPQHSLDPGRLRTARHRLRGAGDATEADDGPWRGS